MDAPNRARLNAFAVRYQVVDEFSVNPLGYIRTISQGNPAAGEKTYEPMDTAVAGPRRAPSGSIENDRSMAREAGG